MVELADHHFVSRCEALGEGETGLLDETRGAGSKEHLLEQGCQLWRDGQWVSLSVLDFGAGNRETVEVEAGLLAHFLLETFGAKVVREIWISTSPFDRYLSVDTALEEICGTNREQIEAFLFSSLLNCN